MMPMKGGHDQRHADADHGRTIRLVSDPGTHLDVRTVLSMDDNDHLRCEISLGRLGIYFKAHQIDLSRVTPP